MRALRDREGLTQADLAIKLGWEQPDLSKIERGLVEMTVERQRRAAKFFGVSQDIISGDSPLNEVKPDAAKEAKSFIHRVGRIYAEVTHNTPTTPMLASQIIGEAASQEELAWQDGSSLSDESIKSIILALCGQYKP